MTSAVVLALAVASTGGLFSRGTTVQRVPVPGHHRGHAHAHGHLPPGGRILRPGPGPGWGFPNGQPDGYGWVDYGDALPLGADRTADYFFPRYLALMPQQAFLPQYYNPYIQRGQRYVPYAGCGGAHPFGMAAPASADTSLHPDRDARATEPVVPVPSFNGRVEAAPVLSEEGTGLP
jgi:hypothetical protein